MYLIVSPFKRSFNEIGFIFSIPDNLINKIKIGQIVKIPLWKQDILWVILKIYENENSIEKERIKNIIEIIDEKEYIKWYRIELSIFIANYYFSLIHNSVNLFIPKKIKDNIEKKLLIKNDKKLTYTFNYKKELNIYQKEAYKEILKSNSKNILLFWLTGSWKTEIYINLIKENLELNKQSLLLVPEIVLTQQLYKRIKEVFWNNIIIINSNINEKQKANNWYNIDSWNAKIIIWTRSAIFYPYNNLWIIIIDEEHDLSYISDKTPKYHTIKIAEKISELNWNTLLLWSGTPSIISMYKVFTKKYKIVNLLNKF